MYSYINKKHLIQCYITTLFRLLCLHIIHIHCNSYCEHLHPLTLQKFQCLWPILPLSRTSLCQVKHLPRVQIPHEGLDDLSSLKMDKTHTHKWLSTKHELIEPCSKDKFPLTYFPLCMQFFTHTSSQLDMSLNLLHYIIHNLLYATAALRESLCVKVVAKNKS